jgi:DNA replication ATP-dependent helicase Dna2
VSLFRRLSDAHPQAVIDLMNKDIMLLSNKLIYGDHLQSGSEMVANRTLNIPDRQFLQNMHKHT